MLFEERLTVKNLVILLSLQVNRSSSYLQIVHNKVLLLFIEKLCDRYRKEKHQRYEYHAFQPQDFPTPLSANAGVGGCTVF